MVSGGQAMMPFPLPLANEVHIHGETLATEITRYVSPDEMRRADRLLDPSKRNLFMASRGLLREILGRYLGIQPQEIFFVVGAHGKPFLSANAASNDRLHFNLSHSGTLFLLAVAVDREVGIDVEQLRNDTPFPDMARLAFSPREQRELFALPDHLQRSAFYRCWTRKEAYLKACGMGFDLPSNSFDVSLLPETPASLIAPGDLSHWILQDIRVPDGYCATLAVQESAPIIRYCD
jgi:4'-phosphopantetheinyl transferase